MKHIKSLLTAMLFASMAVGALTLHAADKKHEHKAHGQARPYPLTTCIVSGDKLDSMGDPYVFTHAGREIKMCCKGCLDDFKKDTAKYLKQLDAAEKKHKK